MNIVKYNANGNDFIVYHDKERRNRSKLATMLCHRQKGVGADGMIVLMPHAKYDFEWDFYNSDGSYAKMCGNATRAATHYAVEKGISRNNQAEFLTGVGVIHAEVNGTYITTDMPEPKIIRQDIESDGENWWLIDTGVAHLVTYRDSIDEFDIMKARELRMKYDANINIYTIENNDTIYIRTYERGVEAETLACGTGIIACYVRSLEDSKVSSGSTRVIAKSKEELYVQKEEGHGYRLSGNVIKTFTAEIESILF